jgi:hypothetical protein
MALLGLVFSGLGCVEYYPAVRMQEATVLPDCAYSTSAFEATPPGTYDKITVAYDRCEFGPDQGYVADPNRPVPPELQNMAVPFGKKLDLVPLTAVLSASARSTWTYILENFPVEIYRMPPTQSGGCLLFQELDVAPSNVRCVFESQANDLRQEATSSIPTDIFRTAAVLQGLYWAAGHVNPTTQVYSHRRAIIYIRTDVPRWTLVHEFVHHLFRDQRIKDGEPIYNESMASSSRYNLIQEIERLQTASQISSGDIVSLLNRAEEAYRRGVGYLLQNDLEEVTIEYILVNLYQAGLLTYTQSNAAGSISYIRDSARKARRYGGDLIYQLEQAHFLMRAGAARPEQLSQIESFISAINSVLDEADWISRSVF